MRRLDTDSLSIGLPPSGDRLSSGNFFGDQARIVRLENYTIGLWRAVLPSEEVVNHTHADAHFIFAIDEGYRSLAQSGGRPAYQKQGAGSLIWNPAGIEHCDSFDTIGGRFLSVSFRPPKGAARSGPSRLFEQATQEAARRLVGQIANFATGDELVIENLVLDLTGWVISPSELDEDPAPEWLVRATEVISDLSSTPGLEVRTIAATVGVHPVSLARRYRRHFGLSPAAAIRQDRAARAAAALVRECDLADLAIRMGYADQSHLSREFREIYGVTPGRYRKAIG